MLHSHLWSLRRLLDDGELLESTSTGYSLRLRPGGSDLDVFLMETDLARAALSAGDAADAAGRLRSALALWRGPALDGTHHEFQADEGPALEELRLAALAQRIDADLILGRHGEIISELRLLVVESPLNEKLRSQLIRVLHATGRTAEALEEFRSARRHFRDELGLEPGEELVRLHQSILAGEPTLGTTEVKTASSLPLRSVPRQLPGDVARFVGREESLRQLDTLLEDQDGRSSVIVTVITGAPGLGKTTLATRWGHRVADRFPDGQLYVNLHGYSQGAPVPGTQALSHFLRGLGVAADQVPHGLDEKASLYRSLMADKRILVVLDNAAKPDQVRPLIPGLSLCRVVVTSRDLLRGLSVTHDVHTLALDVLSADEAEALLVAILGEKRTRDESAAVTTLASLCGHLPLALRLAAAHLAGQPGLSVADFATRLAEENALTALDIEDDPYVGIRAAFETSYRNLPEAPRKVFRFMGLHPGPDIGIDEITALTGLSRGDVRAAVEGLVSAHLVQYGEAQRLVLHDLIRVFARERCDLDEDKTDLRNALSRLFDWYLHAVKAAMGHIYTEHNGLELASDPPPCGIPTFENYDSAAKWLDVHYSSVVAIVGHAAACGWPDHAWKLADAMDYFFYLRNRTDDWMSIHQIALSAVREVGDKSGECRILNALGAANMHADRVVECLNYQRQALELSRAAGDVGGEAYALSRIGYSLLWAGGFHEAMERCSEAVDLYRALGNEQGEAIAFTSLGIAHLRLGNPGDALNFLQRALAFDRKNGNPHDEGYVLTLIGDAYEALGDLEAAAEIYRQSTLLNRGIENYRFEANALAGLGRVYRRRGRLEEALDFHVRALALIGSEGDRWSACEMLMDLGIDYLSLGDAEAALENHRNALSIADSLEDPYLQGLCHGAIAHAFHALDRVDEAEESWLAAFDLLSPLGVPEAREIGERITGLTARH
ncbi:BTAD domain-containing putative transcriptional regulator [Planomonospora sphaerica]